MKGSIGSLDSTQVGQHGDTTTTVERSATPGLDENGRLEGVAKGEIDGQVLGFNGKASVEVHRGDITVDSTNSDGSQTSTANGEFTTGKLEAQVGRGVRSGRLGEAKGHVGGSITGSLTELDLEERLTNPDGSVDTTTGTSTQTDIAGRLFGGFEAKSKELDLGPLGSAEAGAKGQAGVGLSYTRETQDTVTTNDQQPGRETRTQSQTDVVAGELYGHVEGSGKLKDPLGQSGASVGDTGRAAGAATTDLYQRNETNSVTTQDGEVVETEDDLSIYGGIFGQEIYGYDENRRTEFNEDGSSTTTENTDERGIFADTTTRGRTETDANGNAVTSRSTEIEKGTFTDTTTITETLPDGTSIEREITDGTLYDTDTTTITNPDGSVEELDTDEYQDRVNQQTNNGFGWDPGGEFAGVGDNNDTNTDSSTGAGLDDAPDVDVEAPQAPAAPNVDGGGLDAPAAPEPDASPDINTDPPQAPEAPQADSPPDVDTSPPEAPQAPDLSAGLDNSNGGDSDDNNDDDDDDGLDAFGGSGPDIDTSTSDTSTSTSTSTSNDNGGWDAPDEVDDSNWGGSDDSDNDNDNGGWGNDNDSDSDNDNGGWGNDPQGEFGGWDGGSDDDGLDAFGGSGPDVGSSTGGTSGDTGSTSTSNDNGGWDAPDEVDDSNWGGSDDNGGWGNDPQGEFGGWGGGGWGGFGV